MGPSPSRLKAIDTLTKVDEDDRMFYRERPRAHWKPLRTPGDYSRLNAAIDSLEAAYNNDRDGVPQK